jgi:hypothetical protein
MSQYEVQSVNKFDPEIDKWDSQKLTEHLRKGKLNPAQNVQAKKRLLDIENEESYKKEKEGQRYQYWQNITNIVTILAAVAGMVFGIVSLIQ